MGTWSVKFSHTAEKQEAIAKLLCPEKSMFLRPFASDSKAAAGHLTKPTPSGLVEEDGREWPQKGDFNGQMSVAIASQTTQRKKRLRFN